MDIKDELATLKDDLAWWTTEWRDLRDSGSYRKIKELEAKIAALEAS